mmetsp:Transcript_9244/g.13887  ORF Transcript_9244/g.13887 Transcript_9244/m.13887 type:complete len:293 (+) Transcript_9244:16-894(+)
MASTSAPVYLHPMVVMNVADHITRTHIQFNMDKAFGILLGTIVEGNLHATDCIEVELTEKGEILFKDVEEDLTLHKESYPKNEALGWYCTATKPTSEHMNMFQEISKWFKSRKGSIIPNPIFLMMNPEAKMTDEKLPVIIYDIDMKQVPYQIKSDVAEDVTVVHCVQQGVENKKGSKLVHHYESIYSGLETMKERLSVLYRYVKDCKGKKVKPDPVILTKIKNICSRLPTMETAQLMNESRTDLNDSLLIGYLASLTRNSESVGAMMKKFNSIHGIHGSQSRGFSSMEYDDM